MIVMASERQNMSDQEISIKEREHELYDPHLSDEAPRPVKAFTAYLRETPAQPISPVAQAILWMTGIVVAMLFLAALWKVSRPRAAKPPHEEPALPVAKTAMIPTAVHWPLPTDHGRGALMARGRAVAGGMW
jgi:hypothetical protein